MLGPLLRSYAACLGFERFYSMLRPVLQLVKMWIGYYWYLLALEIGAP